MNNPTEKHDLCFEAFYANLNKTYGETASNCRHEIYYLIANNSKIIAAIKAMLALLRDITILISLRNKRTPKGKYYLVCTLPGKNGWGTLSPAYKELTKRLESPPLIITHPRILGSAPELSTSLNQPNVIKASISSIRGMKILFRTPDVLNNIVVYTVFVRSAFWVSCWDNTLPKTNIKLLLHNDFDMMSSTAVIALKSRAQSESYCIQHGLPTQEFFPCRADYQITWGASSTQAYLSNGVKLDQIIETPVSIPFQQRAYSSNPLSPKRIELISQTHTTIYGVSFSAIIPSFAQRMQALMEPGKFIVLLHPNETSSRVLYEKTGIECSMPPHESLKTETSERALIMGFSSTALIDAALAGHYTIGIRYSPKRSLAANSILRPPIIASSPEEAVEIWRKLNQSIEYRKQLLQKSREWIEATFSFDNDPETLYKKLLSL